MPGSKPVYLYLYIRHSMIQREAGIVAATVKLLFLCVFFSGGELSAQDKTFLWKVESERNSVYILGSIHLLNKDSYPLHRKLQEAFNKSNKLVLEIDLNGVSTEKIRKLVLVKGMISDGTALPQKISKETYEIVVKHARTGLGGAHDPPLQALVCGHDNGRDEA
jgi:uncharacterized protein YbaP (TraB family)